MNFSKILIPIGVIAFVAGAWYQYKWPGVAVSTGAVVMWILLHFTRMVTVMSRAANRPIGHVASAVMLNVKLKKGVNLMHVIAMTKSLGERLSITALPTCPMGLLAARVMMVTMRVKCNKIHMTTAPMETATPGHWY